MEINLDETTKHNRAEMEAYNNRARNALRVPFLESEIGLGDMLARATGALGVKPCGGCEERREAFNEAVTLRPWSWG